MQAIRLSELLNRVDWAGLGLWAGLVTFTLGLSFLLWTRWGNYHLMGKCLIFSMLAHLLLGLFFATEEVVDNVVVALNPPAEVPAPIAIEQVQIDIAADETSPDSQRDGQSDEDPRVAVWDRSRSVVVIDRPDIAPASPLSPTPPAAERSAAAMEELPQQSPRPAVPVAGVEPSAPQLVRSMPESPERVETPVTPQQPTPMAAEEVKEVLPEAIRSQIAAEYGTGPPGRANPVRAGTDDEDDELADAIPRVSPRRPAPSSLAASDRATTAITPARRSDGSRAEEIESNTPGKPLALPETATERPGTQRESAGGGAAEPSATGRPGFSAESATGKGAITPSRTGTPGGDGLPLPPSKLRSSASSTADLQQRRSPTAIRPGGAGDPTGDREGTRVGAPLIYQNRTNPNRSDLAVTRGGSKASEQAVERALEWLAVHQHRDGHWDAGGFQAHCPAHDVCSGPANQRRDDCAITGLVLLAFLGAGNTHQSGSHAQTVSAAINWLIAQQKPNGDLRGTGRMYSQGIATLALSEALGMTGDPKLRVPVERAVTFIAWAQNPTSGGWRYDPGQHGDTSIFGWQLMALKSAALAGITVPDRTWQNARGWLELDGSGRFRGRASYRPGERPTPAMTAEALACRLFLGDVSSNPAVGEAADYLMDYLPQWSRLNLYYWYYGTVASYQVGGSHWEKWNTALRDPLIDHQRREGHAAGSWDPAGDPWGNEGGRIYSTALATLCLEVYYRFLPLQSLSFAPHGKGSEIR